jgi:hypothetical protein
VIGADGRRFDSKTDAFESDTAQKIFFFESGMIRLAYAWTGSTEPLTVTALCMISVPLLNKACLGRLDLLESDLACK